MDKDIELNTNILKKIEKDIQIAEAALEYLKNEKADCIEKRLNLLRQKYPYVYPVYWGYTHGVVERYQYKVIHVCPSRKEAEDFTRKILAKDPILRYDYGLLNKLCNLEAAWESPLPDGQVKDENSPEYQAILDLRAEIERHNKAYSDYEISQKNKGKDYTFEKYIERKFGNTNVTDSHFFSKDKVLDSNKLPDKLILRVEMTDPDEIEDRDCTINNYNDDDYFDYDFDDDDYF